MKFAFSNVTSLDRADVVTIGVPDESQSHAKRQGTSKAPAKIREISNTRDSYTRKEKSSTAIAYGGFEKMVFDYGDILRDQIPKAVSETVGKNKIPFFIGGDHSISAEIVRSIAKTKDSLVSLVYFDAHPDIVSSTRNYYGSVFYDMLECLDVSSSLQVGIRSPEQEELDNIRNYNISVVTPFDISNRGVAEIAKEIEYRTDGKPVYVSFDMDVIDPAYAPAVSVPVPMGLGSTETCFLVKSIAQKSTLIGMDIMEVCPAYDMSEMTCHLASRMMLETISSLR